MLLREEFLGKNALIGGGQIYSKAIGIADKMVLTRVHTVIEDADTFFPKIDSDIWKVESRSDLFQDSSSGVEYEFVTYIRK